jgi:hypothetical protein
VGSEAELCETPSLDTKLPVAVTQVLAVESSSSRSRVLQLEVADRVPFGRLQLWRLRLSAAATKLMQARREEEQVIIAAAWPQGARPWLSKMGVPLLRSEPDL